MNNASNEYLRNAVLTASPEHLHLMLYDGAIRFARQGAEGVRQKNWEDAFNGFSRAQKIVLEMLNSLNYEVDEDLCQRMAGLYGFIYQKLVEGSIQRDVKLAQEAVDLLEYQRETWVMLIERLSREVDPGDPARPGPSDPSPSDPSPSVEAALGATHGTISFQG